MAAPRRAALSGGSQWLPTSSDLVLQQIVMGLANAAGSGWQPSSIEQLPSTAPDFVLQQLLKGLANAAGLGLAAQLN